MSISRLEKDVQKFLNLGERKMKTKFNLGELVVLDPTGKGIGKEGKIIGRTEYIDGSFGYVVSVTTLHDQNVVRNYVAECEICYPK